MNKLFTLLTAMALLSACSQDAKTSHGPATKVADYLYEVNYNSIDESYFERADLIQASGACSSVRNGSFHGRNLDLFYNESCEAVVHVAAAKDRFASMAVCGGIPLFTAEKIENDDEVVMAFLPFAIMDGINENNVVVNINVVPSNDIPVATGTNPGGRRFHMALAPRYILNNAQNARHAVELLKELDLYGGLGEEFGFHLMISDPNETIIVEVIDNKLVTKINGRNSDENIMTNLFSTLLPEYMPHSVGIERYGIIKEHYQEGATEEGMAKLMQSVRYTQAYERTTDPFWYSESYGITVKPDGTVSDLNINTPNEVVMAHQDEAFATYERHERKGEFWQTINTSVYNIDERSLLLFVQEDYEHAYRFKL